MTRVSYIIAAAAATAVGGQASAQLTLGMDVNDFAYSFADASGASFFGGADHTGTMSWSMSSDVAADAPRLVDVRMGDEGPFGVLRDVPLGTSMADFDAVVQLDSGRIRGGNLTITLGTGDTYTADFAGGSLVSLGRAGYALDGLTMSGAFSDDEFGAVDVSEFNALDNLPGWAFAFRFNPSGPDASGTADAEIFAIVPLPPAALAGLGMLAGVMGLSVARRRR